MTITVADKIEMQELAARYNRAVDSRDAIGWADTFTDDGVFVSMRVGTYKGRKELLAFAQEFWTGDATAAWRGGQHWATNFIIEGHGDSATMFSYHIMFMPQHADKVDGVIMAANVDELRKVAGSWKIARREVVAWPPAREPGARDESHQGAEIRGS